MGDTDSGDRDVNITSDSVVHNSDQNDSLKSILTSFCTSSLQIRTTICSGLNKTSFSEVSADQMIGKGNTKLSKEYLANCVITLARLAETLDPIVYANSVITCGKEIPNSCVNGVEIEEFKQYVDNMQSKLENYDTILQSNQQQFDTMYKTLTELVHSTTKSPHTTAPNTTLGPNTTSPHAEPPQPPCSPYVTYVKDAVSEPLIQSISLTSHYWVSRIPGGSRWGTWGIIDLLKNKKNRGMQLLSEVVKY